MTTKFTSDHEWVRVEGDTATVGITKHAAEQLGDVVFVELPDVGKSFGQGDDMAVVESVKAASDERPLCPPASLRRAPPGPYKNGCPHSRAALPS